MNFAESIKSSFSSLISNKMRSILTMLGIIIGISSVILISTIGQGAKESITKDLSELTKTNVSIELDAKPEEKIKRKDFFSENDIELLKSHENINQISPKYKQFARTVANKNTGFVEFNAGNENYIAIKNFEIILGRTFNADDNLKNKKVVVVDDVFAIENFGRTDILGEKVEFRRRRGKVDLTVIGVVENPYKKIIETTKQEYYIGVVPYNTAKKYLGVKEMSEIIASLKNSEVKEETAAEMIAMLERIHNNEDLYVYNPEDMNASNITDILNKVTLFITFVASISLLVGGIGVMNIMLVTVTERTREIGIRKAIGARNKDILLQFLIEAIFLTLLGGVSGIIIGYIGGVIVGNIVKITPVLSINIVIIAVTISSIIGITFGVYPAKKASKLNPIEALRHE